MNDFLQVCGDGTLQLIQLDLSGFEANRVRSEVFFSVMEDAIFDRVASSENGWFLITHSGTIFHATTDDDEIIIEDGWNPRLEGEENWRPGGRNEIISAHHDTGLIYVAMHEGPIDTHHEPGTEIWVLDANLKRRIARIELETPANSVLVTQEASPKLLIVDTTNSCTSICECSQSRHILYAKRCLPDSRYRLTQLLCSTNFLLSTSLIWVSAWFLAPSIS